MKYNILWITTDQQRFDTIRALGCEHIRTPNLDRLSAEGVAFSHAYCQNPICTPSRSSFMTGRYPSSIRACINGNERFSDDASLISKRLNDHGYDCGLTGKLHLASPWNEAEKRVDDGYSFFAYSHGPGTRLDQGNEYLKWLLDQGIDVERDVFQHAPKAPQEGYGPFRPEVDPSVHQTTWCTDRAMDFIGDRSDRPWFLSVNYFDPHLPFDPPEKYRKRYDENRLPGAHFRESDLQHQSGLSEVDFQSPPSRENAELGARIRADYYAMIELIDDNVGRLLDFLEDRRLREKTIVIFMSDHGEMLGDHGLIGKGCRFYEGLVRVPLIMSFPKEFKSGLVCNKLVELVDLAPTLMELADIEGGEEMPGRSLCPILFGKQNEFRDRAHVRCEYYNTLELIPERTEPRRSYGTMVRDKRFKCCVYHGLDYGELFDLENDPWEHENLWDSEQHQAVKNRLIKTAFDQLAFSVNLGTKRIGRY